jgi:hypothetical protein
MGLAGLYAGNPAGAEPGTVTGRFDTQFVIGGDCGAPSGICAEGTTSGNLKGAFTLGVSEVIATADTPDTGVVLFIGDATVETKHGTLRCKNSGALQTNADGILTSLCVVTPGSGTGEWSNASGYFEVSGTTSLAAGTASGEYRGRIVRQG